MRLIALVASAATLVVPAPAAAQQVNPLADFRLRWEDIDQDGFDRDAHGVTVRGRAGVELMSGEWSLLAEGEATLALVERYDSGFNGKAFHANIADPENIELNRLQLQYRGLSKTVATLGRQRINLEDQRFVGSVGWRQNEQTFDALRIEHGDAKGLHVDLTYAWSVRTIWGVDGRDARQQAIGGNNIFAIANHPTPLGRISAFVFLIDQDEAAVQGFRLSSQTYGLRLAGSRKLSPAAKFIYTLSYAGQSDWDRNPNHYRADYWLAEIGAEIGPAEIGLGYEELGADEGLPLTSFQTPLATLHKFQGSADKFQTTPPNGVRDWYANASYSWQRVAGLDSIAATLVYHRFNSDGLNSQYGNEWDAMVSVKRGRSTATVKIAAYDADDFATDTRKLWLQLDWSL